MPFKLLVSTPLVLALCLLPRALAAQTTAYVRVVNGPAPIMAWLQGPGDVLRRADTGTTLAVLDEEEGWYWVVVPPDIHGTRKAGWIRARDVEPAPAPTRAAAHGSSEDMFPLANAPPPEADPAASPVPEEKVTITERRDDMSAASSAAADRPYRFEDVLFDRDRYTLREDDMGTLRAVVAALKADPALVIQIEGHTCSLGTPSYNLALGARRAEAVKEFLMREGIAANRLHTVSLGETQPRHDNSNEETRRLNRRVEVVPDDRP